MESNVTDHFDHDCPNIDGAPNNFQTFKLRFSLQTTILIYFIYLLPFCFGVFGNVSVCLIFFQQKKLRSITNTFLMNLCELIFIVFVRQSFFVSGINDLIVLCVSIPMTLSAALLEHWIFGEFLCKFLNFTPTLTALVSTFTVATIAVERWFFIVNKKKFDRRCTILILILLWLISILIALPEFLLRYLQEFAAFPSMSNDELLNEGNESFSSMPTANCGIKKIYFCVFNPGLRMRIFSYIVITVQYLVPFLFVSISCYSISRFLKNRMKHMRTYQNHSTSNSHSSKRKSKKTEQKSHLKETMADQELTSCDETHVNMFTNKSNDNFSSRQGSDRLNYQHSIVIDRESSRSSSIGGTVLIATGKSQSHSKRRFHRSRKLLICVAALFTVSWLPLTVVQLYLEHHPEVTNNGPDFVYAFLLIPCYLISSLSAWINPIIYNYINRSFRREFYALYSCCCKSTLTSSYGSSITRTAVPSVIPQRSVKQQSQKLTENQNLRTRSVSFADQTINGKPTVNVSDEPV